MNYLEWSQEYFDTAAELAAVIDRLKAQRRRACPAVKKEIDEKLSCYRCYYRECLETAKLLRERHRGAA